MEAAASMDVDADVLALGVWVTAFGGAATFVWWLAHRRWSAARGYVAREVAAADEQLQDAFVTDALSGRAIVLWRYGGALAGAAVGLLLAGGSAALAIAA